MPVPSRPAARHADSAEDPGAVRTLTSRRLEQLQRTTGYPLISVVVPTALGSRMAPSDRGEIERLLRTAESRLALELDRSAVDELVAPLRALADAVAIEPTREGLVLYHGAGVLEAYRLMHGPVSRLVIDPTFATRDLVHDQNQNPRYRLLVLAAGTARLYTGAGHELDERASATFPVRTEAEPTPDRRGHLHQAERADRDGRRWEPFLRAVDDALRADRDTGGLPLVLAAAEPLASMFRNRTSQQVIGVVPGNHEHARPSRLAQLARPVLSRHLEIQRREILDELERATGTRRAAFGVQEVWAAARDGRVLRLVVDPGFFQPANVSADPRRITVATDPEVPEVIDDAVDDIIEMVALHGGKVSFVPLADARGIAAVLRSRSHDSW